MRTSVKGILVTCVLLMFSIGANAQTKVVIIPLGEGELAKKRVFITSTLYTGNLVQAANDLISSKLYTDAQTAADALCQSRADAAGLGGSYRAWLSTQGSDAIDKISETAGPWFTVTGTKVADTKSNFATLGLKAAIDINELGEIVIHDLDEPYEEYPWTGTTGEGLRSLDTCNDWNSSNNIYDGTFGVAGQYKQQFWTKAGRRSCENLESLYCLEY